MRALLDNGGGLVDLESFCDRCTAFSAQIVVPEAKKIKVTRNVSEFCVTASVTLRKMGMAWACKGLYWMLVMVVLVSRMAAIILPTSLPT